MRNLARALVAVATAALAVGVSTPQALAIEPLPVVHSEFAQVGPYRMQISFTDWPLLASKSLDFTFLPDGGIAASTGTLAIRDPGGADWDDESLYRYPRARDRWGLDTFALPDQGTWTFDFTVNGPDGKGTGTVALPVGPRPGPSLPLSWAVAVFPAIAMIPVFVILFMRGRRAGVDRSDRWTWT